MVIHDDIIDPLDSCIHSTVAQTTDRSNGGNRRQEGKTMPDFFQRSIGGKVNHQMKISPPDTPGAVPLTVKPPAAQGDTGGPIRQDPSTAKMVRDPVELRNGDIIHNEED